MSALKPIENRNVRGVLGDKYPLNTVCAHPDCTNTNVTAHHIFGRPPPHGSSWFVEITLLDESYMGHRDPTMVQTSTIPHVIGLCGSGTTGHHGDLEEHRGWVKYEDGEFVWYDRDSTVPKDFGLDYIEEAATVWTVLGLLDPQPASGLTKSRKKRTRLKGDDKRKKKNVTIKVPNDADEEGAGLLYDAIDQLEDILGHDPSRSMYYTIMDGLNYAILNEGR